MQPVFMAVLLLLTLAAGPAGAAEAASEDMQADGEWVVVLTDPRPQRQRGWATGVGYASGGNYASHPALDRLAEDIASRYAVTVTEQWPVRNLGVHCLRVRLEGDESSTLEALDSDPRVQWVQRLNLFEGSSAAADTRHYRSMQSSLDILNVGPLHESWRGTGVRVAVIDSAVESDHPDLKHAIEEYRDFAGSGRPSGGERHGTGIAGVIAAADNRLGITGVAPGVELHAYRACWETAAGPTRCDSLSLSRALDRAVDLQPRVINLSLTGPGDRLLDSLLQQMIDRGTIAVAAFDTRRDSGERFPAAREGVLYVRQAGQGHAAGQGVLLAPGEAVLTSQPGHSWDFMAGHSLAAAHVSGVLALMLEANPDADFRSAHDSLQASMHSSSIDACSAVAHLRPDFLCGAQDYQSR